jgi:hypothetical protein
VGLTNPEENRKRSKNRARKIIKRLVDANFGMWADKNRKSYYSKFLTLTFADEIVDPLEGNKKFTLFIKRLNWLLFKTKKSVIKYLAVIEFMPKSKKVHYHVLLFNLPYIERIIDKFNEAWGHGYLLIKAAPDKNVGRYFTKYITKSDDEKLRKKKSFFCSRNLIKPIIIRDELFIARFLWNIPKNIEKYSFIFDNEHTGKTEWTGFNILNYPKIKELILAYKLEFDKFKS